MKEKLQQKYLYKPREKKNSNQYRRNEGMQAVFFAEIPEEYLLETREIPGGITK